MRSKTISRVSYSGLFIPRETQTALGRFSGSGSAQKRVFLRVLEYTWKDELPSFHMYTPKAHHCCKEHDLRMSRAGEIVSGNMRAWWEKCPHDLLPAMQIYMP